MGYADFFERLTGFVPYPWARTLGATPVANWPELIEVQTGAGKTAAVTVAWLWHLDQNPDVTPRRLVWCLPMRSLVEQTAKAVRGWLDGFPGDVGLHAMLGGSIDLDWRGDPAAPAVIVGTQDQVLSRQLNRGYGESRFSWPMTFGLLNNDVLVVCDEVQLMGPGLATTRQLAAFRDSLGTIGRHRTVWMSATAKPRWLETVDNPAPPDSATLRLGPADMDHAVLGPRLRAEKTLRRLAVDRDDFGAIAEHVASHHRDGELTLVVLNTVERATAAYKALAKKGARDASLPSPLLVHSRFRPPERAAALARLNAGPAGEHGQIVVSTQVVEAGVDISASVLVTDLAPIASLIQRFGRCNRYGEVSSAEIWWLDPQAVTEKTAIPYAVDEVAPARTDLVELEGTSVAPSRLPDVPPTVEPRAVLRRRDLMDVFDTTPDLAGNDVDVSRFIRDGDDTDVSVFWRERTPGRHDETVAAPHRDELCPVPVRELRDWVRRHSAWTFDRLTGEWAPVGQRDVRPGRTILVPSEAGGYDPELGWAPKSKARVVEPAPVAGPPPESTGSDRLTYTRAWVTLTQHCDDIVAELDALLGRLGAVTGLAPFAGQLRTAARWHDAGKAHPVFQHTMQASAQVEDRPSRVGTLWAKSGGRHGVGHERPYFRHELVSALAVLDQVDDDLVAYLVAAHHGKVRLSIRSLPDEKPPTDPTARFARGVHEGDEVPAADLGAGVAMAPFTADLSVMELGTETRSWLERSLALRDDPGTGPFRLAYLETLVRAADWSASDLLTEDAVDHEGTLDG